MLKDNDFKALISLLDDTDPEVSSHVWEKLTSLGPQGITRLEAEWEVQESPAIQARIEDLIHRINLDKITGEILEWRKGGGKDLLEGWLLFTKFQFPDLDFSAYINEINRLVNKTWLEINSTMDTSAKLRVLNHVLFVMEGYKPNRKNQRFPDNNFVNYVIDQKTGNPVSLGILYLIICKKLELPVAGVILPGYYVLFVADSHQEFYLDVFNGGAFFKKEDLKRFLEKIKLEEKPSYFKPTSNIYTLLQLIRNLAADYRHAGKIEKAIELDQLEKDIEITFD